jgi:hypothetical protein
VTRLAPRSKHRRHRLSPRAAPRRGPELNAVSTSHGRAMPHRSIQKHGRESPNRCSALLLQTVTAPPSYAPLQPLADRNNCPLHCQLDSVRSPSSVGVAPPVGARLSLENAVAKKTR